MNLEFFFRTLMNVWLGGEILVALFTPTRRGEGRIQDRGTQVMLWVVIIAAFKIDDWMHSFLPADMPGSYSWLRPTAFAILIPGLGVRATAIVTLGRAFSANHDPRRAEVAAERTLRFGSSPFLSWSGADFPGFCPARTHMGLFCCCSYSTYTGRVVSHSC